MANQAALPASATLADAYLINGNLWVWDGSKWNDAGNIQGPQGITGPQGPVGLTGPTGPQGVKGEVGNTGPAGPTGPQGPIGLTGPVGSTGPQGPIGLTGPAGPQGLKGDTGNTGPAGPTGPQGPIGLTGPVGSTGPQGPIGLTGPAGPQGLKGDTGSIGPAGPTGPTGLTGPAGPQGAKGDAGNTGPAGPTGPQGLIGLTGPVGPAGPQGVKGETGNTGPAGPTGPQGPIGLTGPTGPQGPIGLTGQAGPIGPQGPQGPAGPMPPIGGSDTHIQFNSGGSFTGSSNLVFLPATNRLGINTSSPTQALDVNGQIRIRGGSPAVGRVLTSDANGVATWAAPTGDNWGSQTVNSDATLTGNGTSGSLLRIAQQGATNGQVLKWNGSTWAPASDNQGISLPYSATSSSSISSLFTITDTGTNGAIKGVSNEGSSIVGLNFNAFQDIYTAAIYGATASASSTAITGENQSETGQGVAIRGLSYSSDGYSGYFSGGRFVVFGRTGIGTSVPQELLHVNGGTTAAGVAIRLTGPNVATDNIRIGLTPDIGFLTQAGPRDFVLGTNGTGRMRIKSSGRVGINENDPQALLGMTFNSNSALPQLLLTESENDYARLMFKNNQSTTRNWSIAGLPHSTSSSAKLNFFYFNGTSGADIMSISGNGLVGINTSAPTQALHVVGNAYKTSGGTSWATSSDLRLKTVTGQYQKGLKEIISLQPVTFIYNADNPRQLDHKKEETGFVAQDVQLIFPEAVTEAEDGYLDFNIHPINVALVNAMKELNEKIEALERDNNRLTDENNNFRASQSELNARLERLENMLLGRAQNNP